MDQSFYTSNRHKLYEQLGDNWVAVLFAGKAPRMTADSYYPFFTNRNFVYLTGLSGSPTAGFVLMAHKREGEVTETLYILPRDAHAERWNGRRLGAEEVQALSGIEKIALVDSFPQEFHRLAVGGRHTTVWLNLDRFAPDEPQDEAHRLAARMTADYPALQLKNLYFHLRRQRTIKQPCEIEAMKQAMEITREGIMAMMRASRPGMYEYRYKAIFDHVLADHQVLAPAFPSIISAGNNNFCIHYDSYTGQAQDGDMILNDVGAAWDHLCNDVSRGFPCNGKFSERQRLLYTCAYNTSEYMFGIIKPGMPMRDVDATIRRYNFEQLRAIGLCDDYEQVGKYMWHGGAHHVGFDVHDVVDSEMTICPGMVFCIDVGIYCEEWGIGFRLEDNCLVTEDGCVNLSAAIPRTIEEIEAVMQKN